MPHVIWRMLMEKREFIVNYRLNKIIPVDENVPYMRDVMNCEFPFKLCQGFCHVGMMSKRSEMMSCHYRIETHVSRTPAAFGLALIPAGATQAASQVGNAVWSGSRMNLRNSLSNPLSVMHAV